MPGEDALTTGNRDFAECKFLCRVSKIGHSAKIFFAECIHRSTRQRNNKKKLNLCRVPSRGHSAKYFKNKKNFFAERQI